MRAQDIMTAQVVIVGPETEIDEVASLLLEKRVSGVPVVDGEGRVLGIVSEGDLLRRPESGTEPRHSWWLGLFASGADRAGAYLKAHGVTAGDVMTRGVVTIRPDTPVGEIAETLERHNIKRVPVLDGQRLVGIVSRANILRGLATHKDKISTMLHNLDTRESARPTDDETIRANILERLGAAGLGTLVNPIVTDGVAHLWGSVRTNEERDAIRLAAQSVEGVKSIESHIGLMDHQMRSVF